MKRIHHKIEQNTDEWLELRLGKFTASSFKDLFMSKKTAGYEKAIYKVVYERLTGESPEFFSTAYMDRGHDMEPLAVDSYEQEYMVETYAAGFWTLGDWIGASPDRLIGSDGLLEVKAPAYNTMINYLLKKELPKIYSWQVQGQLYVTGRKWCDFMAFHPKLKPLIIRVERNETLIAELSKALDESIEFAKTIISKIGEK
jgi:YqaJ-like viral recombinase domain